MRINIQDDIARLNNAGLLDRLLADKTTKKNIIWATSSYSDMGELYQEGVQMSADALAGMNAGILQPRIVKDESEQQERTRSHAEVFTPSWVCNQMNNYCDEDWFGRKDVFNVQNGQQWKATELPVTFPKRKTWKHYVDSRRLEITCGEAPFIVSRYDAATGEIIPIKNRIGVLDRKLRVVTENAATESEWITWAVRAFQSVYGYEYQGDNLLICRINLLMTFDEYLQDCWHRAATKPELEKVANIVAWNFWQMDGLKGTVPLGEPEELHEQFSLFDTEETEEEQKTPLCRIYDWRARESLFYESLKEV